MTRKQKRGVLIGGGVATLAVALILVLVGLVQGLLIATVLATAITALTFAAGLGVRRQKRPPIVASRIGSE